jgi:glutaryl-CoA dehydrogenase (non-decarboxylating)
MLQAERQGVKADEAVSNAVSLEERIAAFMAAFSVDDVESWEHQNGVPRSVMDRLGRQGLLGAMISKDYGGLEQSAFQYGVLCSEIAQMSMSLLSMLTVHSMASEGIRQWGTDEQRAHWLPQLASGALHGAFALTETAFGSEATGLETRLTPTSEGYRLNGEKQWISYAQCADVFLVFAQSGDTSTESLACLIPASSPGLSIEPVDDMMGFKASHLGQLHFNDCLVTPDRILGKAGMGIPYIASSVLDLGRLSIAWGCVGAMAALIADSVDYSSQRQQFGQPIAEHQLIQRMLANMITQYKASHALCTRAAQLRDASDPRAVMETTVAKYFASTASVAAVNDALQIHGARGFSKSAGRIERFYRDLKVTEIIEGSSEMQQIMIAQNGAGEFRRLGKHYRRKLQAHS